MLKKALNVINRMLIIIFSILVLLELSTIFSGESVLMNILIIAGSTLCLKGLFTAEAVLNKKAPIKITAVEPVVSRERCA